MVSEYWRLVLRGGGPDLYWTGDIWSINCGHAVRFASRKDAQWQARTISTPEDKATIVHVRVHPREYDEDTLRRDGWVPIAELTKATQSADKACDDRDAAVVRAEKAERDLDAKHAKLVEVADKLRKVRGERDRMRAVVKEARAYMNGKGLVAETAYDDVCSAFRALDASDPGKGEPAPEQAPERIWCSPGDIDSEIDWCSGMFSSERVTDDEVEYIRADASEPSKAEPAPEQAPERVWKASDELDGIPIETAENERRRTKAWMETAAFHARNEEYWRGPCDQRVADALDAAADRADVWVRTTLEIIDDDWTDDDIIASIRAAVRGAK